MCDKYETFLERELSYQTDLEAYLDERYGQDTFVVRRVLYKLLRDRVMNCLGHKSAVEVTTRYSYGDSEMIVYKKTQRLKDKCEELKKYEMGDSSLLDRLLPQWEHSTGSYEDLAYLYEITLRCCNKVNELLGEKLGLPFVLEWTEYIGRIQTTSDRCALKIRFPIKIIKSWLLRGQPNLDIERYGKLLFSFSIFLLNVNPTWFFRLCI